MRSKEEQVISEETPNKEMGNQEYDLEELTRIAESIFLNNEYRERFSFLGGKVTFTLRTRFGEDIYDTLPTHGVAQPVDGMSKTDENEVAFAEATRVLRLITASLVDYNGKRLERKPGDREDYERNLKFILGLSQDVILVIYKKLVEFDKKVSRAMEEDILGN